MQTTEETRFTTREVAEKLDVSTRTVQRIISARQISFVRIGGRLRIPESALMEYLARRTCEAL
jgi:excisionase family DNA binding protein